MNKPSVRRITLLASIAFGICIVGSYFVFQLLNAPTCDELASTIPDPAPVYPASVIVMESDHGSTLDLYWYEITYEVNAPIEEVTRFYDERLSSGCRDTTLAGNEIYCEGKAKPFGLYTVLMDRTTDAVTSYTISTELARCGGF